MQTQDRLLEVKNLKKYFFSGGSTIHAVDDVSFQIGRGETLGLVGESGCGKSTLGRTVLQLLPATSGEILYDGVSIRGLSKKQMAPYRQKMQMVFQDPYGSLNPRYRIETIVGEAMTYHKLVKNKRECRDRVAELLEMVGLRAEDMDKFPHEFSGGQRQRIGIARALSVEPEFLICDEPVSALDVSIQSQILNLLDDLRGQMHLTMIFIAHGLNVVKHVSDRVGVMYLGKLVELSPADDLFCHQYHPYTQALLSAIPEPRLNVKKRQILLSGELPSPADPPKGCRFCTRCPYATQRCRQEEPEMRNVAQGRGVACFYPLAQ